MLAGVGEWRVNIMALWHVKYFQKGVHIGVQISGGLQPTGCDFLLLLIE